MRRIRNGSILIALCTVYPRNGTMCVYYKKRHSGRREGTTRSIREGPEESVRSSGQGTRDNSNNWRKTPVSMAVLGLRHNARQQKLLSWRGSQCQCRVDRIVSCEVTSYNTINDSMHNNVRKQSVSKFFHTCIYEGAPEKEIASHSTRQKG